MVSTLKSALVETVGHELNLMIQNLQNLKLIPLGAEPVCFNGWVLVI
ncbi:TPA: hypothetical protein I8Y58_002266 [Legionella pneumophila]|uniref:Uncharacterized protein n=1 Tax=Legionella pneumophila TaxID=446 RepID=A0AAN5KSD4_LEGPN|nr:hypothetical protein [Legionella pneumophila]HAT1973166.1 hypothetical protein [Legionella pneumophila]HCE5643168.1 hypothetical protein [Legionella pneumophila]HCE5646226.1 hypothetical protein [Legionella pneumophila]